MSAGQRFRKPLRRASSYLRGLPGRIAGHRLAFGLSSLLLAGLLAGAGLLLFHCRSDTHVRLRFAADRLAFTPADEEARFLDDPLPFQELLIEDFERLTLPVTSLRLLSPAAGAGPDAAGPDVAGLDVAGSVTLSALGQHSTLLLRGPGRLGRLRAPAGSRVVLEVHAAQPGLTELTVKVDSAQQVQIAAGGELAIEGTFVALTGPPGPPVEGDSLRLTAAPAEDRVLTLESRPGGVTLGLTTPAPDLFSGRPFAISELELLRQELDGRTASSLVRDAELSYPDDPERPEAVLSQEQYLILEQLQRGELTLTAVEEGSGGIGATFEGLVRQVRSGTRGFSTDRCVRLWEWLFRHPFWSTLATLLSSLAGAIPVGEFFARMLGRRRPTPAGPTPGRRGTPGRSKRYPPRGRGRGRRRA